MIADHDFSFENLTVYQCVRRFVKEVYLVQSAFPIEEKFALGDQLRRASISISSNLAEGSGRASYREKIHFIGISYGSLMEVYSQLQLSVDLGYLCEAKFLELRTDVIAISKMLSGLRSTFQKLLNNQSSVGTLSSSAE